MNKLQQEIAEIIEPYCDKTLDFGLLVFNNTEYNNLHGGYEYDNGKLNINTGWGYNTPCNDFRIIGHYDITAVLKFSYRPGVDIRITGDNIAVIFESGDLYYIPNKPLNLYTEQENKDLLELLKKLGN